MVMKKQHGFIQHHRNGAGFTLIELLVVIAIIGVLSTIILASLNTARGKSVDAAILADLHTIQNQAELYYYGAGNNSYGTQAWLQNSNCSAAASMFSDLTIQSALKAADSANGSPLTVFCYASAGTSYVIGAQLTANAPAWWCIDSIGSAKLESGIALSPQAWPVSSPSWTVCP